MIYLIVLTPGRCYMGRLDGSPVSPIYDDCADVFAWAKRWGYVAVPEKGERR